MNYDANVNLKLLSSSLILNTLVCQGRLLRFLYREKNLAPEIQVFNFSEEGVKLLINRFFRNIFEFLFRSKALVDILAYILLAFLCIFNRPVFCNPKVNIGHV